MGLYSTFIFPRLLDCLLGADKFGELRRQALAPARGHVLEIGFGTGLNLGYYPEQVTQLTAIDSELMLPKRVAERIAQARMPVERMQLDAAGRLPFADQSFDSAVSTWTLCSIANLPAALVEIRRVLKPDGQFIFLEHGRSDDAQVARRQDFFNPIQKFVGRGCHLNRPIDRLIEAAGLKITKLDRFLLPNEPRIAGEMYRGTASPNYSPRSKHGSA
jgi:ubiquinone/menaquinone biosynthesis C-methylase UbiE